MACMSVSAKRNMLDDNFLSVAIGSVFLPSSQPCYWFNIAHSGAICLLHC